MHRPPARHPRDHRRLLRCCRRRQPIDRQSNNFLTFVWFVCSFVQGTRLAALLPQDILETFRDKATPGPRGKEVTKAAFDTGMQASGSRVILGLTPHLAEERESEIEQYLL